MPVPDVYVYVWSKVNATTLFHPDDNIILYGEDESSLDNNIRRF